MQNERLIIRATPIHYKLINKNESRKKMRHRRRKEKKKERRHRRRPINHHADRSRLKCIMVIGFGPASSAVKLVRCRSAVRSGCSSTDVVDAVDAVAHIGSSRKPFLCDNDIRSSFLCAAKMLENKKSRLEFYFWLKFLHIFRVFH